MRYFFHIDIGDGIVEDFEGQDFDNLEMARSAAISAVRNIVEEALRSNTGMDVIECKITIADDSGAILSEMSFADAIRSIDKFYGWGKALP